MYLFIFSRGKCPWSVDRTCSVVFSLSLMCICLWWSVTVSSARQWIWRTIATRTVHALKFTTNQSAATTTYSTTHLATPAASFGAKPLRYRYLKLLSHHITCLSPCPPTDIVWAKMILWRIRGKIKTVLFCAVLCMTVVHKDMHTRMSSS